MSRKAYVVIGSGYGDEGKGTTTNYLAMQHPDAIVVRFNGGAQAGHTVEFQDVRHVFGHFGSGTFQGLNSYFSSFCSVNPWKFKREYDRLSQLMSSRPRLYVNERCIVTTPADMIVNQLREALRGPSRHGSCGMGINETVTRCEDPHTSLTVRDLVEGPEDKFTAIRSYYTLMLSKMIKDNGHDKISQETLDLIVEAMQEVIHDATWAQFQIECDYLLKDAIVVKETDAEFLLNYNEIIFEGAQGLQLDQTYGAFPHVTRSNTGLENVERMTTPLSIKPEDLHVYYITRFYQTRHGAGPLENEVPSETLGNIEDLTNKPNKHQGSLRFSPLNVHKLNEIIYKDLGHVDNCSPHLVVTCMDQIVDDTVVIAMGDDEIVSIPTEDFKGILQDNFEDFYSTVYVSKDQFIEVPHGV